MEKQDLTQYSDNELSLRVFNDEVLYSMRKERKGLKFTLDELFEYTEEQWEILVNDLDEEEE
jgi:hypothetical protein